MQNTDSFETAYERYEKEFRLRLSKLRIDKGVSARDMSLSLGQNPGYINCIENGKSLPSIKIFFAICDYLEVTPNEFFDIKTAHPQKFSKTIDYLLTLDDEKFGHISAVIEDLSK